MQPERTPFRFSDIEILLARLGASMRYTGYRYVEDSLLLMLGDETRILSATKCLYPEIACRYQTSISAVERNIRTLSLVAWRENRPYLEAIAGHNLERRPTSSEFLAILYKWLSSGRRLDV